MGRISVICIRKTKNGRPPLNLLYLFSTNLVSIFRLTRSIFSLLSIILLIATRIASAQDLRLFEETESNNVTEGENRARTVRRDSDGNIITGPEFTLIGTTRLGDNFIAVVEDRVGEIIPISFSKGAETPIPGYPGFQVLDIGSGNVVMRYPGNVSCIEFRNQGVSCEASDIGRLELANADPLESSLDNLNSSVSPSSAEEPSPNPFEALLERASNSDVEGDSSAFTPRRINPEDVPPGMRVVSTPFGDRLVEEE